MDRNSEKDIAPFVAQEIDARNFIRYKYGQEITLSTFSTPAISFRESSTEFLVYERKIEIPLVSVIRGEVICKIHFSPSQLNPDIPITWRVYINNRVMHQIKFTLDPTIKTVQTCVIPIKESEVVIKQVILKKQANELEVQAADLVGIKYVENEITAEKLKTPIIYLKEIILQPNDEMMLETLGCYFKNDGTSERRFNFEIPLATRKIQFIKGNPEVLIFFLKKGKYDWPTEEAIERVSGG